MWDTDEVTEVLRQGSLLGGPWGSRGDETLRRIEDKLGIALGQQLRQFVLNLGNLRIGPFNVIVAGDEAGSLSAVTETHSVWACHPTLKLGKLIQVMAHAGEVYLYDPDSENISAYDALRPVAGEETLSWTSFEQFVDWIVKEAQAARDCPP